MQEKQEKSSKKKCKSFRSPNDNLHKHEYMRKYDNSPVGAIFGANLKLYVRSQSHINQGN